MAKVAITFENGTINEYDITDKMAILTIAFIKKALINIEENIPITTEQNNINSNELEISIEDAISSGYNNPENIAEVRKIKKKWEDIYII